MNPLVQRRSLLLAASVLPLASACTAWSGTASQSSAESQLAALESASGGRLGVVGFHTGSGARIQHRPHERFPLCSTFKLMLAAAVLERSTKDSDLLSRNINYGKSDLVAYSPITEKHVATGMTVAAMCAERPARRYRLCTRHRRSDLQARPHRARTQHQHSRRPARHLHARGHGRQRAAAGAG
jgi:beta-lactamase class A